MPAANPQKKNDICEMFRSGFCIKEIAKYFSCSEGYISRVLTDNGIHLRELPPDEDIVSSYKRTLSSNKTAKELGISQNSVLRCLARSNIAPTGLQNYRINAERHSRDIQTEILHLYESGLSLTELQKRFGGSCSAIAVAIRRMGGTLRNASPLKKPIPLEIQEEIIEMHKQGVPQWQICMKFNISSPKVSNFLISKGLRTRRRRAKNKYKSKMKHHSGYILVGIPPDDPMSCMVDKRGYVAEHRLAMARKLGRPLLSSETVHHINGDKQDNRPENLQLRIGRHGKGQSMECAECHSNNIISAEWLRCADCESTKIRFAQI